MTESISNKYRKLKQTVYKRLEKHSHYMREQGDDDPFGYTAVCPVCGRRVFDIRDLPDAPVDVRLKCPHHKKIVDISISKNSL